MNNVSLSICIPTYNRFQELDETLYHVTRYSKKYEFIKEILVLDNNENNKAKERADKYLGKFEKLNYIKNPYNIGGHENFKKCIETAKSDFVWILTDDDILYENSLELVHKNLRKNIDCLIVNWDVYDQNINKLIMEDVINSKKNFINDKNFILSEFFTKLSFVSSIIFKKEDFNNFVDDDLYVKYTPYGLTCALTAYSIFLKENCKIHYEKIPVLKQRGDNNIFLRDVKSFYNVFSKGMKLFHKNFLDKYYDKNSVKISKRKTFYFYILRNLIDEKIKIINFKKAFKSAYNNYNDIFQIKILLLVIYMVPNKLILFYKKLKSS